MESDISWIQNKQLAQVVRKVDNTIHWINHYPVDSVVCFVNNYPLDSVIHLLKPKTIFFLLSVIDTMGEHHLPRTNT